MSKHFVAAFPFHGGEEKSREFQRRILSATSETENLLADAPEKVESAQNIEIRVYPELWHKGPIPELDDYVKVFFLDENAMRMCEDLGLTPPILREITQDAIEKFDFFAKLPYLPMAAR
jgi:hypothetical protein